MSKHTARKNKNRRAAAALVCALAACLVITAAAPAPAYASGTTYKSPFKNAEYTLNSSFSGDLVVNGVDVSYWQSTGSNWKTAKKDGADFAILRVSYSGYGTSKLKLNQDSHFSTFYKNAKAAGVLTGVYVFSQAKTAKEAIKEADYAVKRLKALGIEPEDLELPVYMDYEYAGGVIGRLYGISKTAATNSAVAFCNRIKSYGYTPGIYANLSFFNSRIDRNKLASDVDIWCAQYNTSCSLSGTYSKWQYSSTGSVGGISGSVDVNYWFIDQDPNPSPLTIIKGRTTLSSADAADPSFSIYYGETLLEEGSDYIVAAIGNNSAVSKYYAYIKGVGDYGGYALIPLTIASASEGSEDDEIDNSSCANYLNKAVTAKSSYINVSATAKATKIKKLSGRSKGFYVKVQKKKKAYASGYQVRYSLSSDMSGSVTKTIGSKYYKVSKTVKTGKKKAYYYVQVRTYKDKGGLRFYSKWSSAKRVRTK